jgi:hypothetical protein
MDQAEHRELAKSLYNGCWELLEKRGRSDDDDVELLTLAFSARYHWLAAGGPEQWVISDWMVSRVAAALGEGGLSVAFALRANEGARAAGGPDWLVASTAEGLARAYAANGQLRERNEWHATAARLVDALVDEEERALIADQLSTVPE